MIWAKMNVVGMIAIIKAKHGQLRTPGVTDRDKGRQRKRMVLRLDSKKKTKTKGMRVKT